MTGGWVGLPNEAWLLTVAMLQQSGLAWPVSFQVADMRWWEGQLRMKRVKKIPGHRALSRRWMVSEWSARCLLRDEDTWKMDSDSLSRSPHGPLTEPSRSVTSEPNESPDSLTVPSRSPHGPLDVCGVEEERTKNEKQTQQAAEPALSLVTVPRPAVDPIPEAVREAVAVYRKACGFNRAMVLDLRKGEGKDIAAIVKVCPEAADLFAWLTTSMHDRAQFYRAQQMRGENIKRHLDALLDYMHSTPAAGASKPQAGQTANDAPSARWAVACERSGFQFDQWPQLIPERHRGAFLRASQAVGGAAALGRVDHPMARKRLLDAFDAAITSEGAWQ